MSAATRNDVTSLHHMDGRAYLGDVPLSCGQPLALLQADGTFLEGRYEIGWTPEKHDLFFTAVPIGTREGPDPEDGLPLAQLSTRIRPHMLFRAGGR